MGSVIPTAPSYEEGDQTDDQVYFVFQPLRTVVLGLPLIFSRTAEYMTSARLTLDIGRTVLRTPS